MKIDLTRKEYRDLLDILAIANWVLNAHKVDRDPAQHATTSLNKSYWP